MMLGNPTLVENFERISHLRRIPTDQSVFLNLIKEYLY